MGRREDILAGALKRIGDPALVERLVAAKAGDVHTVLLEAMRRRSLSQRPADVLRGFERRFCAVSDIDPATSNRIEAALYRAAAGFEPLELSPVTPLGSASAVGPCDPSKILATIRALEVVSDPSNVLALEAARRRRRGAPRVDLAAHHRALRMQAFDNPAFRAHFKVFVLVSMFPSTGSGRSEREALCAHLAVYDALARALGDRVTAVSLSCAGQPWTSVRAHAGQALDALGIAHDDGDDRIGRNAYYQGLSFVGRYAAGGGEALPMIDGGFVRWGAALLGRSKERTLVSAIGSELVVRAHSPRK